MQAVWSEFCQSFPSKIALLPHYHEKLQFLACDEECLPPVMLCGPRESPLRLLWQEAIRRRYNLTSLPQPTLCEGAEIPHYVHERFLLLDLMHPQISKNIHQVPAMLTSIGSMKTSDESRRIIILEHIDQFQKQQGMEALRVICERFTHTTWFIATTHNPSCIDPAIRSRFVYLRCPAFSPTEIELLTGGRKGPTLVDALFYPDTPPPQWTRGILGIRRTQTAKNVEGLKKVARGLSQKLVPFALVAQELLGYLATADQKHQFLQKIMRIEEQRMKVRSSLEPYCYEQLLWEFFCLKG